MIGASTFFDLVAESPLLANLYVADKKAKKRWLWQLLTKIAIWIVIIILVVYFVATNIN